MAWLTFDMVKYPIDKIGDIDPKSSFEKEILAFIGQWQHGNAQYKLTTSGSTGTPKEINISKQQMIRSASQTISVLNLMPDQTSLLCINPEFIGGKMMLVRSLINDMNIIAQEPSSNPLATLNAKIDFMAIVPMQLSSILEHKASREKLDNMKAVIIGGGAINATIEEELKSIDSPMYATYGMTETVSHIALRRLNGQNRSEYFTAFDDVVLGQDQRNCLTITSPITKNETIVTNDIVELIDDKKFKWVGRADNVINTGGIKIQSEDLEQKITKVLTELGIQTRIFVYGMPDKLLGERIVLFIEGVQNDKLENLKNQMKLKLSRFEIPKEIIFIKHFTETDNGKIQRSKTAKIHGHS